MLTEAVRELILAEQARQRDRFIEDVALDVYLAKLDRHAEILADMGGDRCRGFVAFYCNDRSTAQAFITLVLVDPRDRGLGIGRALVACVLELVKQRGFTSCRLEVAKDNTAAHPLYRSLGFCAAGGNDRKDLLEIVF